MQHQNLKRGVGTFEARETLASRFRRWALPLVVIGMNSLAVYMATSVFDFRQVGRVLVGHLAPLLGVWIGFVEACAAFLIVWSILYWMYKTKSFVRV